MMETRNYHTLVKRQRGEGFVARCVELPGCLSEGRTEKEALTNIQDAIKVYLGDMRAEIREKKAPSPGTSLGVWINQTSS